MSTVGDKGSQIYYEQRGGGPRLLFLNGSGTTMDEARLIVDLFAPRFEVLAFDYRGLGRSDAVTQPYDMAACAGDALAVMDDVGWESARVVGISFGGMVAQELAVTEPGRTDRLVLLCTSPGGGGGSSYPLHELEELSAEERLRARRLLMDTRFDDEWLASHPADQRLVDMLAGRSADLTPSPEVQRGKLEQFGARKGHDVWDRLGSIRCPTFIGCGRFDGIAPMANSEAMASRIAGSELHAYEGGHAFLAQDPSAIGEILEFLERPTESSTHRP
jgi:3-oxoadipate enol-lactonase